MAEFKIIETQDELDRILGERLDRERAKATKAEESLRGEIETLKKSITEYESQLADQKTKISEFDEIKSSHASEVAKLTGEIAKYKLQEIKHRVAHANGLPYELAERLTGEDEESLQKDAETLKGFIAPKQAPPLANHETEPADTHTQALRETLEKLKTR